MGRMESGDCLEGGENPSRRRQSAENGHRVETATGISRHWQSLRTERSRARHGGGAR